MLCGVFAFPFSPTLAPPDWAWVSSAGSGRGTVHPRHGWEGRTCAQEMAGGEASEERVLASRPPVRAELDQYHLHPMPGCCLKKAGVRSGRTGSPGKPQCRGPPQTCHFPKRRTTSWAVSKAPAGPSGQPPSPGARAKVCTVTMATTTLHPVGPADSHGFRNLGGSGKVGGGWECWVCLGQPSLF